jgi:signal transduction histidine kinase
MTRSRRDVIVDSAAVLLALAGGAAIAATTDLHGMPWAAISVVAGTLSCLALWWRRRWPVQLAVALAPISAVVPMSGIAAAIALFTLVVHRPARVMVPVVALHAAAVLVYPALYPDGDAGYAVAAVFGMLLLVILVGWGMWIRARREVLASLRERADRAEAEQRLQAEKARLAERERIAREMHDVLAHRLSLLSLHAGALEFRPDAPPEDIAKAAAVIRDNAHTGLEELRAVIGALRESPEAGEPEPPQPTLGDLPRLVEESRAAGMTVTLDDLVGDLSSAPGDVGRHAYRIAQEGLTNARKHAPRCAVDLRVSGAPGAGLTVELRNPMPVGVVAAPIPGAGAGLAGLAERVGMAGGRLEHGPTADGDYRLSAWLPWAAA